MEQNGRLKIISFYIVIFVCIALFTISADILIFKNLSEHYTQKENLIYELIGNEEQGIDFARYLKEDTTAVGIKKGKEKAAALGYDEEFSSVQQQDYYRSRNKVIGYSVFAVCFIGFIVLAVHCFYVVLYRKKIQIITKRVNLLQRDGYNQLFENDEEVSFIFPGANSYEEILDDNLKSLNDFLILQNERMTEEKEATKRIVTDISHQIKTPIAALKNCIELLREEGMTKEERREFILRAGVQMDSLSGLVNSMVNISRMENGMISIHREYADIVKTIREAVSRVWEKADKKQIEIMLVDGDNLTDINILHDPKWTVEALSNILDNAIKYSFEYSNIKIRLIPLTMYIKIEIEDEGIGISKEEYNKIFQRFYRSSSVRDKEGTGIGLYLTREIIERQRGSIVVRSAAGNKRGSIFSVQLPYN